MGDGRWKWLLALFGFGGLVLGADWVKAEISKSTNHEHEVLGEVEGRGDSRADCTIHKAIIS